MSFIFFTITTYMTILAAIYLTGSLVPLLLSLLLLAGYKGD